MLLEVVNELVVLFSGRIHCLSCSCSNLFVSDLDRLRPRLLLQISHYRVDLGISQSQVIIARHDVRETLSVGTLWCDKQIGIEN